MECLQTRREAATNKTIRDENKKLPNVMAAINYPEAASGAFNYSPFAACSPRLLASCGPA